MRYPEDAVRSQALYERAKKSLPGGNTRTTVYHAPFPVYAVRGEGCRVFDADGVARIDCINNFTSMIHGHAHPAITRAIASQAALGTAFGMPTESEIVLAETLCARVASIEQVRFTNSGTEAVMMAIKTARAFTGRPKLAKCEGAYHGSYDYAEISLDTPPEQWSANDPKSVAFSKGTPESVLADVVPIPFNDVAASTELIRRHGAELGAILVDPMPNRGGLVPADRDYLSSLRAVADEVGAVLIFDEVITFRLGFNGAQAKFGVTPDLTVLGKIIGGGFPVGAVGGNRNVMSVFDPTRGKPALPHGGTFSANPMTMGAGQVSMTLLDHDAFVHLDRIGDKVRAGIDRAFENVGMIGRTTGMGSLLRVHFTDRTIRDYRSAYARPDEARKLAAFHRALINRGIVAANNGLMALSTTMTEADADEIVAACEAALRDVAAIKT
jgi:glutamate-1-semialdehyde 2,1-aminomutase